MKQINSNKIILVAALIAIAFVLGTFLGNNENTQEPSAGQANEITEAEQGSHEHKNTKMWTCSMHPQIQKPGPGKCPICSMDLIPVNSGSEEDSERQLSMSESARNLARIETTPVENKRVSKEIRMVGKIDYDEGRVKVISTRVAGRIDKLYVDYTGINIKKGEHLISLYSPDLYSAQEEFIQASQILGEAPEGNSEILRETADATLDAARERLRQWGLTKTQIENIEKTKKASDHLTIYSPISGVVVQKNAVEGNYVKTGTQIYTIADLTKIWVKFDAYESDLNWLRLGQRVSFTVEAFAGEKFEGRISFIDPILNPQTRTVKIRVNVKNHDLKLKPDMYVTGHVFVDVSPEGGIIDNYLAGKWIAPMHPEIVRKGPGTCPICGMKLVKAKSLGYVSSPKLSQAPLIIPASAALITGKRAVVYVELPDRDKPTFEGREITLGPRTGDYYIVKSGLEAGERVVTRGAFKIDSELQIRAKTSMMSSGSEHEHEASH